MTRALFFGLLVASIIWPVNAQKTKKKKDEEPPTQTLAVLPEPPNVIVGETSRLSYQVSPLSSKGLLSQQVRDALKALERSGRGATIVKLRAFVAGSGDLRRVKELVSEEFAERKLGLPVVSTIQVGALPMTGAQVVIESTNVEKKIVNPLGLAFISGQTAADAPSAIEKLKSSVTNANIAPNDVLRVTCFLSSLDQLDQVRSVTGALFTTAFFNFVQMQRLGIEPQFACEAIARLNAAPASTLVLSNGVAFVNAPKIVMTEAQLVFQEQDADIRLAFQRLSKILTAQNAAPKNVFWTGIYSLTHPSATKIETLQQQYFSEMKVDPAHPPTGTSLLFEGLPSSDATAAVEWMAIQN